MDIASEIWLAAAMLVAAALYSSVGHAGASAYLALMALFGIAPETMRPTALALNILVAGLGAARFARAGMFRWRVLWPFLIGSVPFAFIGGGVHLPVQVYKPLVGVVLLLAAARLLWPREVTANRDPRDPPIVIGVAGGALIGFLSGLTGVGGGIFLSPLLLFMGWSSTRATAGIAAAFILCNSVSGLLGNLASVRALPPDLPLYAGAVLIGGIVGTTAGIRFGAPYIVKALGIVLIVAGLKLAGAF